MDTMGYLSVPGPRKSGQNFELESYLVPIDDVSRGAPGLRGLRPQIFRNRRYGNPLTSLYFCILYDNICFACATICCVGLQRGHSSGESLPALVRRKRKRKWSSTDGA